MAEYELYHHGVKGMKWGVRKRRYDEYGNKRKSTIVLRPQYALIRQIEKSQIKKLDKKPNKYTKKLDRIDNRLIKSDTKRMSDEEKKIYALNYYNDRKHAYTMNGRSMKTEIDNLHKVNKPKRVQRSINLAGSDNLERTFNLTLKRAEVLSGHYSNKVDSLIKDIGDTKLSKIESNRSVYIGNTSYYWRGDEYVDKDSR